MRPQVFEEEEKKPWYGMTKHKLISLSLIILLITPEHFQGNQSLSNS